MVKDKKRSGIENQTLMSTCSATAAQRPVSRMSTDISIRRNATGLIASTTPSPH